MITYAALIPFAVLLTLFVGIKTPLTKATFAALASCSVLVSLFFRSDSLIWIQAAQKTGIIAVEIGLIILGAFFFLKVAQETGVMDSLARLIQEVTPNRTVQAVLVCFPLELMVEGSSGFGTPLLIITPLLLSLRFAPKLAAVLPFLTFVVGIPFGALGTPIRLGFSGDVSATHGTMVALLPFVFIAPQIVGFLIERRFRFRECSWIFSLSLFYALAAFFVSQHGPEFTALLPAFLIFVYGVVSARFLFSTQRGFQIQHRLGISVYATLLAIMWLGKQIFMDELIPGTRIRIFNPGFVFLIFGCLILILRKKANFKAVAKATFERAQRTLFVFVCMTLLVQELRQSGALIALTEGIPATLRGPGAAVLGWLGASFVGTSTMTLLLLSPVVDPVRAVALSAGSAIGVQLAFQSVVAMRAMVNDELTEKEIFTLIGPISVLYIFILTCVTW